MRSLSELVQSMLVIFAEDPASEMARSEHWLEVRERYVDLAMQLNADGHVALASRVDREYQAVRDAFRASAASSSKEPATDDYAVWEAVTEFHLTLKFLDRWKSQLGGGSAAEVVADAPKGGPSSDDVEPSRTADAPTDDPLAGAAVDPHSDKVVNWDGWRLYLGRDTQVSRLFWLLYKHLGQPCPLEHVQRAVERMETSVAMGNSAKDVRRSRNRIAKAVTELRQRLREAGLEAHVAIVAEGGHEGPSYTMLVRRPWRR